MPAERLSMECALSRYVAGRQSATDSSIMRVLTGHITTTKTEATSGASRRSAKVVCLYSGRAKNFGGCLLV